MIISYSSPMNHLLWLHLLSMALEMLPLLAPHQPGALHSRVLWCRGSRHPLIAIPLVPQDPKVLSCPLRRFVLCLPSHKRGWGLWLISLLRTSALFPYRFLPHDPLRGPNYYDKAHMFQISHIWCQCLGSAMLLSQPLLPNPIVQYLAMWPCQDRLP